MTPEPGSDRAGGAPTAAPAAPVIAAVLTAYHPDERLAAVVRSALADCARVIVADNTPGGAPGLAEQLDDPRVEVVQVGRNRGLGGGLNAGMRHLPADAEAVLLMDQDSVLPEGLVAGLAARLAAEPDAGVVAPTPWDAAHGTSYTLADQRGEGVADRELVITSGMLVRRELIDRYPFREDLFNDYVDLAFCLDVRLGGAKVRQDFTLKLPHSIGDRREHRIGPMTVRAIHYPPWRHYWIARNGVMVGSERLRSRPALLPLHLVMVGRKMAACALFEDKRGSQLGALARGVFDGFAGGRISERYLPAGAEVVRRKRGEEAGA